MTQGGQSFRSRDRWRKTPMTAGVIAGIIKPYDLYLLFVVGLIKIADGACSLRLKRLLARTVATAAFRLSPRRRRIREEAISQILPHAKWETRRLVKRSFFEFGYDIFSLTPSRAEQ